MANSSWLRLPARGTNDPAVKPSNYLTVYEEFLAHLRDEAFVLLELGIHTGASLEVWRDSFPLATIIGVDLSPPDLDLGPRVHLIQGDQTNADLLSQIRSELAPDGFAVIIDDASHLGVLTAQSLQALYCDHLQDGGIYVIEDWGTGYMNSWQDGGSPSLVDTNLLDNSRPNDTHDEDQGTSLASHDLGMVGLTKRLVDHVAAPTISHFDPTAVGDPLPIRRMVIQNGLVLIFKPSNVNLDRG